MHHTVFGMSPRVAKHVSDKRGTCPLSHFHVEETRLAETRKSQTERDSWAVCFGQLRCDFIELCNSVET